MKKEMLEDKIKKIIAELLNIDSNEVIPEASFQYDFGADSFDCAEVITFIEEEFDIEISDGKAYEIKTVKDVIDCIKQEKDKRYGESE